MGEAKRRGKRLLTGEPVMPPIAVDREPKSPVQIFTMLAQALNKGNEEEFDAVLDNATYEELLATAQYAQGLNRVILDALAQKEAAEPILVVRG